MHTDSRSRVERQAKGNGILCTARPHSNRTRLVSAERITWKETRARLRKDRERLESMLRAQGLERRLFLFLCPSYMCVRLHRISHYLSARGWGKLARLFWHLNLQLTGADLHPESDIGGGLLIPNPAAVSFLAKAGENLTVMALAGAGGLMPDRKDIGAGPGYPVLGDDVVLAPHSGVLGPVRIGNRVRVSAGCIVSCDLADDSFVAAQPAKISRGSVSR